MEELFRCVSSGKYSMRHPFSGIIVRYLQHAQQECKFICSCVRCVANAQDPEPATENTCSVEPVVSDENEGADTEQPTVAQDPNLISLQDELHVNLWETTLNGSKPFLDIGVMIGKRSDVKELVIDLPWAVELKDVSDLGARLNGEKSVAAIFNEVVHYDGFAEGNFANISFRRNGEDKKPFSLLRLNSQLFSLDPIYLSDGMICTRLTIRLPPELPKIQLKDKRISAYVRFRIRNLPSEVYSVKFNNKDRAIISSNVDTRIIDFRLNVLRGVPEELLSANENLLFPSFQRIHCFLTTLRDEECVSNSKNYNGYRSLMDEQVWNEYVRLDSSDGISEETSVRNYLGYQWTASANEGKYVKDLIVLGRFSKRSSDVKSVIRFIVLVILFGAAGSGVWDVASFIYGESFNYEGLFSRLLRVLSILAIGACVILYESMKESAKAKVTKWTRKWSR